MDLIGQERAVTRESFREGVVASGVLVAVALLVLAYTPPGIAPLGLNRASQARRAS